jgi:hypothetical protein
MPTTTTSSSRTALVSALVGLVGLAGLAALAGCRAAAPVPPPASPAAEVCPVRAGQPLRHVDVFDGPPEELATLIPDRAEDRSGHWELGYVYDAGRFVTIRCKYADGVSTDRRLAGRIRRCDYTIDPSGTLGLACR